MAIPDADLRDALFAASDAVGILASLVRIIHRTAHPGTDYPGELPTVETLAAWWPQCPTDARGERRLRPSARWIEREHRAYLAAGGVADHAVAPIVRAWLATVAFPVTIDRRTTGIMPSGLMPESPAGLAFHRIEAGRELITSPGPVDRETRIAMIGEPAMSPFLSLARELGIGGLQQGRSARLDKRLLVYGLLRLPRTQRYAGARWEVREPAGEIVDELWAPTASGKSSYRPGKHGRLLLAAFGSLSLAVARLRDGRLWAAGVTRVFPNPRNLDLDYVLQFELPDDCDHGALVHRPSLIAAGMRSDPAFDLELSLAYLWDEAKARNGGFRVYATRPKVRRNREGHLLDHAGNVVMGAPGGPRRRRDGALVWPATNRAGASLPVTDWRHPAAVREGTERHPAADKVRELGPDERRRLAFGNVARTDRFQIARDRKAVDKMLLAMAASKRIVIEASRDMFGEPLRAFPWRILEAWRDRDPVTG